MILHKRTLCNKLTCFCRNFIQPRHSEYVDAELTRLNAFRTEHLSRREKKQHSLDLPDLIEQAQEHIGTRHDRQAEHQARDYWQNAYADEHPTELINGESVNEPIYIAKERLNALRYCLPEPKRMPLHEN